MRVREVAIVGVGGVADVHAGDIERRLDGRMRIVAAADVDRERLEAYAARWSVPRLYPTLDALLDAERPDLVHLCTPPAAHVSQAVACLDRGLTVLCEKPPALSLSGLDTIGAAEARGGGRFVTVCQHRFGSGAASLRRLVGEPVLGPPLAAVCHTLWYRSDAYFEAPWRGRWDTEGGGPTMGHGIHQIDLMLSILGEWRDVVAVADRLARPTDTEDFSAALVTFASGAVGTVMNSLLSPRETSYLRFDFANATVELDHLYGYGDGSWRVTAAPGQADPVAEAWAAGPKGRSSGHGAQFLAMLEALDAGEPPPVGTADARSTLELIAAIYASAFTGQRVVRGEIGAGSPFYERMNGSGAPWALAATADRH